MSKVFFYSLLALLVGAALPVLLRDDPGYVLFAYQDYSLETSLLFAGLGLLLIGLLLYLFVSLLLRLNPWRLGRRALDRSPQAREDRDQGLLLMGLGEWQQAYQLLVSSAERVERPLINYLAASLAAFERGDQASCEFCLRQAANHDTAVGHLVQAWRAMLQERAGHLEQSLAIILRLHREAPRNPYLMRRLRKLYLAIQDWPGLARLLPALEQYGDLSEAELLATQRQVARYRLLNQEQDSQGLRQMWKGLPREVRLEVSLIQAYLQRLVELGEAPAAQGELLQLLGQVWDESLVRQLGRWPVQQVQQVLQQVEQWSREKPASAALSLALGRLNRQAELGRKAREYLENALKLSSRDADLQREVHGELADLLVSQGEMEEGLRHYRLALALQSPN